MSEILPLESEKYIVSGSVPESVNNLNAAIERGEFGIDVLILFLKVVQKGRDPRFSKTRPIPLLMREMVQANKDKQPAQIIYKGWIDGRWTWEDVENWENNAIALKEARTEPQRGVYLTRNRRTRKTTIRTEGMFVPRMSLGPFCNHSLCDGAKSLYALILSKAGNSNILVTYTVSLATQLGRTTRTVRNHYVQLEQAGLILREPGIHPNTVKITLLKGCRPDPYREPADVVAFQLARKSANPIIRNMAETVVLASYNANRPYFELRDRRKEISAFNQESNLYGAVTNDIRDKPMPTGLEPSPPTSHSTIYAQPKRSRYSSINSRMVPRAVVTLIG